MSGEPRNPVEQAAALLALAGVEHVVIGGHAVNVWLEPRFTADVDFTISATSSELAVLERTFAQAGYIAGPVHGEELPSGPDFVRWTSREGDVVEIQVAKTLFQREVIQRAVRLGACTRVATKEDLIVLKLIADRSKDNVDLLGLCALPDLDWQHVELWAAEWGVMERLARVRATLARK